MEWKTMTMFFGVILLSAHLLTVSTAPVVPDQNGCAEGEPSLGDPQPLVNLTVLPSLTIVELNWVTVICDAATPSGTSSLPPTQIIIYFGKFVVKTCANGNSPIYQCVYSLNSFFPMLDRIVSCTAANSAGQCRFKVANVTLVKEEDLTTTALPTTTMPVENNTTTSTTARNMKTSIPLSTETARNMTTSLPLSTETAEKNTTTPITARNMTTSLPLSTETAEKNTTTPITARNMTTSLPLSTETARNMSSPPPSKKIFKKTSNGEKIFMTPFGLVTMVFLAAIVTFK